MDPSYRGRVPQVPYSRRQSGGRFRLNPRTLIIAAVLLVVVIIGFVLLSQSGDKSGPLQQHLSARLATLQKISDEGEKNLKSSDLRELNARLRIQLSSDIKSLADTFSEKKVDKTITANEADTASFDSLKEAQLNSRFDDTYRQLLAQKLDSTTALMKELYDKTQSKKLKDALNAAYRNFKQLEDQLTPAKQ